MAAANACHLGQLRASFYVDCRSSRTAPAARLGQMNYQARRLLRPSLADRPCPGGCLPGRRRPDRQLAAGRLLVRLEATALRPLPPPRPAPPDHSRRPVPPRDRASCARSWSSWRRITASSRFSRAACPTCGGWPSGTRTRPTGATSAHPSLPNYLAIFGGSAFNDPQDCPPAPGCTYPGPSVFGQALSLGKTARAYEESMPQPCDQANAANTT